MMRSKLLKPSPVGQPKPGLKAKECPVRQQGIALYPKAQALSFAA